MKKGVHVLHGGDGGLATVKQSMGGARFGLLSCVQVILYVVRT